MAHATIIAALLAAITTVQAADVPVTGIGYRGDGSSIFPTAKPPTKWDDKTNIRWKIPLNNWTYCSPVPVGDRVYITCEPSPEHPFPRLICYASKDGKELWQQEINVLDANKVTNKAERKRVRTELSYLYGRVAKAYELWMSAPEPYKLGHDEMNTRLAPAEFRIAGKWWKTSLRGIQAFDEEDWKKRIASIQKPYSYPVFPCWWVNGADQIGHAFQTPVANADAVFVKIRGCVAAFSHDGHLLWSFNLATGPRQATASPRLYKDRLLVQNHDDFYILDTKTGQQLCHHKAPSGKKPLGVTNKKSRANASVRVIIIDDTAVAVTNYGRIIRISDGKLFDAHLPNIFLDFAYDSETGRVWGQGVSDGGGVGWSGQLRMDGDELVAEAIKVGKNKKDPFQPGARPIFFQDRIIGDKYHRDLQHGNVLGYDAQYKIQTKGKKITPRTAPRSWHLTLIANGHVYALRNLAGKYAQKVTGKNVDVGVCEVYTTDGKHVASNYLSAGPWNAEQEKRILRTGFNKRFSYSCGFNFGPDCVYIVSQDYLFCIGK